MQFQNLSPLKSLHVARLTCSAILSTAVLIGAVVPFAAQATGPLSGPKVRVQDPQLAQQMMAAGAQFIADYGKFQVLRLDPAAEKASLSNVGLEDVSEQDIIALNTGALDTTRPEIQALKQQVDTAAGNRLHLVQFAGPVKPEWLAALEQTGVRVITYIPHNAYLIYGDGPTLTKFQGWAGANAAVQWEAPYLDSYKIHPAAQIVDAKGNPKTPATSVFAIQMVLDAQANAATLQLIQALKLEEPRQQYSLANYLNVVIRLPAERLPDIAAQPEVISIQPYFDPQKRDERQDQIMAANLTGTAPTAPGYFAWLQSKGFSQAQFTASGFAVDISDSGVDNGTTSPGHFGLYPGGNTALTSRIIYNRLIGTPNSGSTILGCDGHGNLNTHIIAGFNDQPAGFPHTDSSGFRYGLGVCPFVKVGSSVVFDPDSFTDPSYPELQSRAYNDGARISANSWGANSAGAYTTDAQTYDFLVRDAQPASSPYPTAGNQQMVIVFAAGNAGSGSQTVGSPATAKNVFTIGAAENVRSMNTANGGNSSAGNDGCTEPDTGADSANDIISFSSRGPCSDGRKKPDIVAPGTHVTGGVGQVSPPPAPSTTGSAISCFKASGVCALPGSGTIGNANNFFPLGQQFYTASSGTSHSTPAVAGSCALLRQYFINQGLTPPSPAMTKAYLMNSARYLDGVGANDSLYSNNQGMGEVNLATAFDGSPRILRDQITGEKFTATGQSRSYVGTIVDPSKPLRVTLAWTDAPGNTSGSAYNNDLDLVVTVGGNTYKGNVFSGATSVTGGTADSRDNVESVFLPAGLSGNFAVTVTAANITSDGVPNEAPSLDQDYALVVYNANPMAGAAVVGTGATLLSEGCSPGNGSPDPGETVTYSFSLSNIGTIDTTNVVATLLANSTVGSPSAPQTYGVLVAGGSAVSATFTFTALGVCGDVITPTLHLQDGAADLGNVSFALQSGAFAGFFTENFDGVTPPALPAGWTTTASGAQSAWVTASGTSDTAPNSAFSPDPSAVGVNELVSPVINLPSGPSQLSFRNSYDLESGYDGGVLEIKIGAGSFADFVSAGGSFTSGGYSGTISTAYSNPLGGRSAWTGNSGGFISTVANLPASASGQPVQLKWRCGSDSSVGKTGWRIDTVVLSAQGCCTNSSVPIPVFSGRPLSGSAPLAVTFTDNSSGTITNRFWDFGDGNTTNTTELSFVYTYASAGTNTVSLTVSSQFGTNTAVRAAYVVVTNPVPVASFSAAPLVGAAPLTVTFNDSSWGLITNRAWNFGNGDTTNTEATTFAFTYPTAGTNTVSLTLSGPFGIDTLSRPAYVIVTNPQPSFSAGPLLLTGGNTNGQVDPNECNDLTLFIQNVGTLTASHVSAALSSTTPGITVAQGVSAYPDVAPGTSASNLLSFKISSSPAYVCGSPVILTLALSYDGGAGTLSFSPPVGSTGYSVTQATGVAIDPGVTDIGLHADDGTAPITLPFGFSFYGQSFTNATLSSNGNLQFNTALTAFGNSCLPASAFNDAIFAHWDDLRTDGTLGVPQGIFVSTNGTEPNRIFNIEWRASYYASGGTGTPLNFEIRLYENQPRLELVYGDLGGGVGASATVGIQHGTEAVSFECNSGGLSPGLQLAFQPGGCPDGGGLCGPTAPTIVSTIWDGTSFSFSFATQTGFTYQVQYKDALEDAAAWQTLQSVVGDGTLKTVSFPAASPAKRFYRLSVQ